MPYSGVWVGASVAVLMVCALAWQGRYRGWVDWYGGMAFVTFFPPLATCSLLVGLGDILPILLWGVLSIAAVSWFFFGLFLYIWRPRWFGPRWVKEQHGTNDLTS